MPVGYDEADNKIPPLWKLKQLIIPVYIVRTVLMNCTSPLKKSILNDHVPKTSRGRWNALDSVTSFGWSGSAMAGGALLDQFGFGFTFLATAAMQALSLIITSRLLWLRVT